MNKQKKVQAIHICWKMKQLYKHLIDNLHLNKVNEILNKNQTTKINMNLHLSKIDFKLKDIHNR